VTVAAADDPAVAATTTATTSTDAATARGDTGEPIDVVFTVGILPLDESLTRVTELLLFNSLSIV
jgi:hypothetical protein